MMKKIVIVLFIFLAGGVWLAFMPGAKTDSAKEYRDGEMVRIDNTDYLLVSNSEFVEILEATSDNKLRQASEVRGMERINDLGVISFRGKPYLIVLTGRYLIKYDISNPYMPQVELKRDLYEFKRGHYRIGYMHSMSLNDTHIFTAGSKGIRRFMAENLFVDKIYYYENARGLAANNDILAVVTPDAGLVYDVEGGNLLKEVPLSNIDDQERQPAIDNSGNIYFPGDNSLVKTGLSGYDYAFYENPVETGALFSYAAEDIGSGIVYANGYGITKFDGYFHKDRFIHTARPDSFGSNSWAVNIAAGETREGSRVAVLNKSSVILLDEDFQVLDQYRYAPRLIGSIVMPAELSLGISQTAGVKGDLLVVSAYGFWPNEDISVGFYESRERRAAKTDNLGFARIELSVPDLKPGQKVISAIGNDSGLSYQITFELK